LIQLNNLDRSPVPDSHPLSPQTCPIHPLLFKVYSFTFVLTFLSLFLQAQLYEQLFSKPKMTEKLLSKPPFRYLHDIFTATLSKTGFGEGLFLGDELNSKSYEDKDSKLKFLAKLVTLTEMILGEKQDIKPSMVLAGQQADKTNLWL
jgi:TRAF3-interacting protein 1